MSWSIPPDGPALAAAGGPVRHRWYSRHPLATVTSMQSLMERLRDLLSVGSRDDRRNIAALAERLDIPTEEAARIYRRSREVGYGVAMQEYEERCEERPTS